MAYLSEAAGLAREGSGTPIISGAPSAGTSEVQTLDVTGTPTGGTFKLSFQGQQTAAIAFNAAAAAVVTALEALSTIGTGGVTATGTLATPTFAVVVTFAGTLAARAVPLLTLTDNSLTGGTTPSVTVTETTPGVNATLREASIGTTVARSDTGVLYIKTAQPGTFTVVGSQT